MDRDLDQQRQTARRTVVGLVVTAVLVYLTFITLTALGPGGG